MFVSAVSLAIAAIPEALPTVTQSILSIGGVDLEQGPRHRPRPNSPAQG